MAKLYDLHKMDRRTIGVLHHRRWWQFHRGVPNEQGKIITQDDRFIVTQVNDNIVTQGEEFP